MAGNSRRHYDVAIVGAGIVGLAHAVAARRRGLSVVVLDRAAGILGASIRNFGHLCLTGQDGRAREYAEESRERWLELSAEAGFWVGETGTVVVAQAPDESAVLEEFRDLRGPDDIVLLDAGQVRERVPVAAGRVRSGAWLPRDLQVDPREAAGAIARWLHDDGVDFHFTTSALGVDPGRVHTSRGPVIADTVIVAVNHDVDQLFPGLAEAHRMQRCGLDMLLVDAELDRPLTSPLFTGWSLIRYAGFTRTVSAAALRARLVAENPGLAALDLNQMYTQRPDGGLIVGDTHYRGDGIDPFQGEPAFEALLSLARELFGVRDLRVRERWQGVYASAPDDFLVATPLPDVRVVSVTTGIGMTTGLGLGQRVIDDLYSSMTTLKVQKGGTMTKDGILTSEFDDAGTIDGALEASDDALDDEYDEFDLTDIDEVRREDDEDPDDDDVDLELVVLDMAGTTVVDDGLVEKAFVRAAEEAGIGETPEERESALQYVRDTMGQSKIAVFRTLTGDEDQAQHANAVFENAYAEFVEKDGATAVPGAEDVIGLLRDAGVKVALTTGFSPSTTKAIIGALGWEDLVDVVLSPADAGRGRPYPDLPLTALLRTGATSVDSMVVVGDTASDMASGIAAGAGLVVGVLTGAHNEATLSDAGADAVIGSIAELPALLGFDD